MTSSPFFTPSSPLHNDPDITSSQKRPRQEQVKEAKGRVDYVPGSIPVEVSFAYRQIYPPKNIANPIPPLIFVKKIMDTLFGSISIYEIAKWTTVPPEERYELTPVRQTPPQYFAVKRFLKDNIDRKISAAGRPTQEDPKTALEIEMFLKNHRHPNVIELIYCLETVNDIFAVYPFLTPDLLDYIISEEHLEIQHKKLLFLCMCKAVFHCHNLGICHRDVSLENFLLSEDKEQCLLIDFGLAVRMKPKENQHGWQPIYSSVGKTSYMSPEVFNRGNTIPYDGVANDIWCLGVCLYSMIFRSPPWRSTSMADEHFKKLIMENKLKNLLEKKNIAPEIIDLQCKMLTLDPDERISLSEILMHPWFQSEQ